ncbi:hypothetical protein BSKO_09764 [Bryopsis sp. KO-2023]|nr:hypothetical protein BSKO_09764 [Bryopsis sp. KO-2023]
MSFCAAPSKIVAPTQVARPGRALVVRCEAAQPMQRVKQVGVALLSTAVIATAVPAIAAVDLEVGEDVFNGNCAACHAGGDNSVKPGYTLQKDALVQYLDGGFSVESITTQVKNGKNAMPAWSDRLDDDEIDSVAAYVFKTASEGAW